MPLAASFDTFGWFARDMDLYEKVADLLLPISSTSFQRILRLPEQEELIAGALGKSAFVAALQRIERIVGPASPAALTSVDVEERYWCFRKTQSYEAWQEHGEWVLSGERNLGPGVKERFEYGQSITDQTFAAETQKRRAITRELENLVADDGLVIMPTVPGAAPLAADPFESLQDFRERALRLLCLSGLTGLPQLTLPLASVDGAPFGISLMGPRGSDRALVALGSTILQTTKGGTT